MKKFISRVFFFHLTLIVLIIICLLIPVTPRASKSLLMSKIKKDDLLQRIPSPRIIFIGGSNLSFGLNSKIIQESLGLNPINTGVQGSIGLIYMLRNSLKYIKKSDIVVVSSEYEQFYGKVAYGKIALLRTILDTSSYDEIFNLKIKQFKNIIGYVPKYVISKLKPSEYFGFNESSIYGVNSFNEYGDVYTHWKLKQRKFSVSNFFPGEFNDSVLRELVDFRRKILKRGAVLFITFPGYQETSFKNNIVKIRRVETELKKMAFSLLGTPKRYMMHNSLMFNTPYHLLKKGLDRRTKLLINDLKKYDLTL